MGSKTRVPDEGTQRDATRVDATTADAMMADVSLPAPFFARPAEVPSDRGLRILILGEKEFVVGPPKEDSVVMNFSLGRFIKDMATYQDWPTPQIEEVGLDSPTLALYQEDFRLKSFLSQQDWDAIVIQGPGKQAAEDKEAFGKQMIELAMKALVSNPEAHIILVQPRAEATGHPIYGGAFFEGPDQMQRHMQSLSDEVAMGMLKKLGARASEHTVSIAPIGQAWLEALLKFELLSIPDRDRLLFTQEFAPTQEGRYLMALMLYGMVFNRSVQGTKAVDVFADTKGYVTLKHIHQSLFVSGAHDLVDAITGLKVRGGPLAGTGLSGLAPGERALIDFGFANTQSLDGTWNNIHNELGSLSEVIALTSESQVVPMPRRVGVNLRGHLLSSNNDGPKTTTLSSDYLPSATSDSFWLGDFASRERAHMGRGNVDIDGLDPKGAYELKVFASRSDPIGSARLVRFSVGEQVADIEALNNLEEVVVFKSVTPNAQGVITLVVRCSPNGDSRFAYLNTLELRRLK